VRTSSTYLYAAPPAGQAAFSAQHFSSCCKGSLSPDTSTTLAKACPTQGRLQTATTPHVNTNSSTSCAHSHIPTALLVVCLNVNASFCKPLISISYSYSSCAALHCGQDLVQGSANEEFNETMKGLLNGQTTRSWSQAGQPGSCNLNRTVTAALRHQDELMIKLSFTAMHELLCTRHGGACGGSCGCIQTVQLTLLEGTTYTLHQALQRHPNSPA
jgi:hypothetical protein